MIEVDYERARNKTYHGDTEARRKARLTWIHGIAVTGSSPTSRVI
jgi:hypothetical protein